MTRKQTWLAVALLVPGVLILFVMGLFLSAWATPPIHQNPAELSAVSQLTPSPEWADTIEAARQIVRAEVIEQNLPGVSVAVGAGGALVWAEGFGWADIENKLAVTPETRFRIGTASMVLTSAGVGLLIEKGQLELDEDIRKYVPDYPEKEWPLTLGQVMGHVAGIRPDAGDEEPVGNRCDETSAGVERFAGYKLLFEPGSEYRFTPYGWMLVSDAIDSVAGEPFHTYMRKQVFEPLQMNRTDANGEPARDRAVYYFPKFAANTRYGPQDPAEDDFTCFFGAGAFLSTASDMVRFGLAIHGGKLLKPETVQMLQAPRRLKSGAETGYGLGWDLEQAELAGEQMTVVGHDGDLRGGRVASFITFPKRGLVIAVLSNISFADTYSLGLKIAQTFAR